jgi:hypothetical protein
VPLVAVLIIAGFHVPVIPFGDVADKTGAVSLLQIVSIVGKPGIVSVVMVTARVTIEAHCPLFGVKV